MILKDNQKHVYDELDMADLDRYKAFFNVMRKPYGKHIYFKIDENGCYVYRENQMIDEVIYVHFQKRKMKVCDDAGNVFYFVQPRNVLKELKDEKNFAKCICYGVKILAKRVVHKVSKIVQLIRQKY